MAEPHLWLRNLPRSSGPWAEHPTGSSFNRFKLATIEAPYHIILQKKNQVLLRFLSLRAVVNGQEIYPLPDSRPVIIPVRENNPRIVITDGFHISRPKKLVFDSAGSCFFRVACALGDIQLAVGGGLLAGLYLAGFWTGWLVLKVFSFLPLVYGVMFYYLNRKDFLKLVPVVI